MRECLQNIIQNCSAAFTAVLFPAPAGPVKNITSATQLISPRGNFPCPGFCFYWESISSWEGILISLSPLTESSLPISHFWLSRRWPSRFLFFKTRSLLNSDFPIQQKIGRALFLVLGPCFGRFGVVFGQKHREGPVEGKEHAKLPIF